MTFLQTLIGVLCLLLGMSVIVITFIITGMALVTAFEHKKWWGKLISLVVLILGLTTLTWGGNHQFWFNQIMQLIKTYV